MRIDRKQLTTVGFLVMVVVAFATIASAQDAGVIVGQVVAEVDGQPVPGATVSIDGTISAITDSRGNFRLVDVPAGEQTVMVTLAGFGEASGSATVVAGQSTTLNVSLPMVFGGEVQVFGYEYGAAKAIAEQKKSDTIVTIVSKETLEFLPDQSIGESLSRVPGIGVKKDRGEVDTIFVRGVDSRLNAVTVNGDRLPSPESTVEEAYMRGNREAKMNTIPATLINEIQVYKAVPANMDADSIGGAVNISTKSASGLAGQILDVTLQAGYNDLPAEGQYAVQLSYGTRLNQEGTWGIMGSLSYEQNKRGVQGLGAAWTTVDEVLDMATGDGVELGFDGNVIEDFDIIWREVERTRKGVNLTLDFEPSKKSTFKLGGFWSEFNDKELRQRLQLRPGASADYTSDTQFNNDLVMTSGATDGGRVRRRVRPGQKDQETYNYFLQGNHLFGQGTWNFDWRLSNIYASRALSRTWTRWEARAQDLGLRGDGIADYTFTGGDTDMPDWGQPAWSNDPNVLEFGNRGDYNQILNDFSEDEITAVKLDAGKSFGAEGGFQLDFGYKGSWRDRTQLNTLHEYVGDEDNPVYMASALGANQTTPVRPYGYENGVWGDQAYMDELFLTNPELFELDNTNDDENYFVDENVSAAYLMGTIRRPKWTLNLGLRYEKTDMTITARDGAAVTDYDNFFPSAIFRWQATDKIVLRASYTSSLGRPDFYKLRPFYSSEFDYELNDDTGFYEGELTMDGGNAALEPFTADSLDLTFEYYTNSGGVFQAGLFYKEIDNFEYPEELRLDNINISDLPDYLQEAALSAVDDARQNNPDIPNDFDTLTTFNYSRPVNGDRSKLFGIEANWQQRFVSLPAPWDKFGIFANFTYVSADSILTETITRDYLIGQFEYVANLQLFWENRNVSARLAYNANGITYEALGLGIEDGETVDNPVDDIARDVEGSLDGALQWYITPRWTLLFDVRNILDQDSFRRFAGSGDTINRFIELENGGRWFALGVRFRL